MRTPATDTVSHNTMAHVRALTDMLVLPATNVPETITTILPADIANVNTRALITATATLAASAVVTLGTLHLHAPPAPLSTILKVLERDMAFAHFVALH